MKGSIEKKKRRESTLRAMCGYHDSNIAPSALDSGDGPNVSFRLRRRSTALGLLNRGIATLYQANSDEFVLWKEEEEQALYEQKLDVLKKNSHIFQKFKDRVQASEAVANPIAARLVLEDFLHRDLVFVGKQGVIQRHSNLIKHLVLTQRSSQTSANKIPLRKPSTKSTQSTVSITKQDSGTVSESSSSSLSDDLCGSPSWSPENGKKMVTFSGMANVAECLQVPELEKGFDEGVTEVSKGSFMN